MLPRMNPRSLACAVLLMSVSIAACQDSDPLPNEPMRQMDSGLQMPNRDAGTDARVPDQDAGDDDGGNGDAGN